MEEQTLRYYIKIFSILFIFIFIIFFSYFYILLNKNISFTKDQFVIEKGEKLEQVLKNNVKNLSIIDINLIKMYYRINNLVNKKFIHYGEFSNENLNSLIEFLNLIFEPGNVLNKITIVEGWSSNNLKNEFSKYFKNPIYIPYENIIADTYYFDKHTSFDTFIKNIYGINKLYFDRFKNSELLKKYSQKEIMVIGSLIEKEGFDTEDKKMISSVIFNRLNKNMKLQIDATVLYAITNGKYDLKRKLLLSDLKIKHPYNTYFIHGLPPKPISYVGKKTLDLIFENYKSDFLFYFYNNSLKKHIFSKTYNEHKKKLSDYRNKK